MASVLFDKAREAYLTAALNFSSNDVRAILVDTGAYTFSAAHQYLTSVAGGARIAVSAALSSKTVTSGVADAADVTFTAVSGASIEAIILYRHTGTDSTSELIAYWDGLSITPNGGDITVKWNASGMFKL
jgi:hypothetical protein